MPSTWEKPAATHLRVANATRGTLQCFLASRRHALWLTPGLTVTLPSQLGQLALHGEHVTRIAAGASLKLSTKGKVYARRTGQRERRV